MAPPVASPLGDESSTTKPSIPVIDHHLSWLSTGEERRMPTSNTPSIALRSVSHARSLASRCRVALGWLGAAVAAAGCDVDASRQEVFRDGGCGAGLEPGLGDLVCDYRGVALSNERLTVVSATCDGSDYLVCEYSMRCAWAATASGSCVNEDCARRPIETLTTTKRHKLTRGDTQCDPPDAAWNRYECGQIDRWNPTVALIDACEAKTDQVIEDPIVCCVDKPPQPCLGEAECEAEDSGGYDDAGDDGASSGEVDPTVGHEPCLPGQQMVCDAAGIDGVDECRCAVAS